MRLQNAGAVGYGDSDTHHLLRLLQILLLHKILYEDVPVVMRSSAGLLWVIAPSGANVLKRMAVCLFVNGWQLFFVEIFFQLVVILIPSPFAGAVRGTCHKHSDRIDE